jgi:hypothetical protein
MYHSLVANGASHPIGRGQVLQGACRALNVSDVHFVVPAIAKLAAAVALLPRLERFARRVVETVLETDGAGGVAAPLASAGSTGTRGGEGGWGVGGGSGGGGGAAAVAAASSPPQPPPQPRRTMEDALPVLDRWRSAAGEAHRLRDLRARIADRLERRSHMPHAARAAEGGGAAGGAGDSALSDDAVVAAIGDLVQLEAQLLARTRTYEAAERALELDPDVLVNRIVLHFQYLFQVRKNIERRKMIP